MSSELPGGWAVARLPDIVGPAGVLTDGDWVESKDQDPNGEVRLTQLADVGDGVFRDRSDRFLTMAKAHELGCTFLQPGDVLIARMPDPLGRACIFPGSQYPCVTVVDVCVVRPGVPRVSTAWLMHFVNSIAFRSAVAALQSGSTRKRISRKNLCTIEFRIPPSEEQERIVAAIESYFSRLGDAVATLERVQANLKRYRASVLKAAVEGRLVPTEAELARAEGRDYEPASALLERILAERRRRWEEAELAKLKAKGKEPTNDKWKARYKEPVAPEVEGLPDLPEGWCWTTVEALCLSLTDGDHLPPPQTEHGVPFLVIGNVRTGVVDFSSTRFVPEDYYGSLDPARRPRQGDLLYTVTGSFGIPVLVNFDRPFCVQRHIAILRPATGISARLYSRFLESRFVFDQAASVATGTAQKTVPLKGLRRLVVPVPPAAEQERISRTLERLLSVGDELTQAASAGVTRCDRLRQSILKWAFEGKLVNQDPSDEPASVLLERIKAEREAAAATKQPTRRKRRSKETTQ